MYGAARRRSRRSNTGKRSAVALIYRREFPAPLVLARGFDLVAERIISSARTSSVPIIQDRELTETLVQLDAGDIIPEECFLVVAQLLAFVHAQNAHKERR